MIKKYLLKTEKVERLRPIHFFFFVSLSLLSYANLSICPNPWTATFSAQLPVSLREMMWWGSGCVIYSGIYLLALHFCILFYLWFTWIHTFSVHCVNWGIYQSIKIALLFKHTRNITHFREREREGRILSSLFAPIRTLIVCCTINYHGRSTTGYTLIQ